MADEGFKLSSNPLHGHYELFGFDILFDASLKAHLMEINSGCSMSTSYVMDRSVKLPMLRDLYRLVGAIPYDMRAHESVPEGTLRQMLRIGYAIM